VIINNKSDEKHSLLAYPPSGSGGEDRSDHLVADEPGRRGSEPDRSATSTSARSAKFVPNAHFASAEAGLAELLANPANFYVNFHSDRCPGGVARGFLP